MKAYILDTGTRVLPFGDRAGEIPIANVPLGERRRRWLRAYGLEPVPARSLEEVVETPCLLVWDKLLFSPWALEKFLAASAAHGRSAGAALRRGPFTEFTRACQEYPERAPGRDDPEIVPFGLWRLLERPTAESLKEVDWLPLDFEQKTLQLGDTDFFRIAGTNPPAFTLGLMMHVEHWMHVWFANLFGIGLEWGTRLLKWNGWGNWVRVGLPNWLRLAGSALWTILSGLTLKKTRLAGAMNLVGRGCEIHHTAVVEGSILGSGVKVGPHAVVRASVLGDGVKIGDHSIVNASVMGEKSTTCTQGIFGMCMCWPEAFTGRMQMVVQGRRSTAASLSRFFDTNLGQEIAVEHKGKVVKTGLGFLGGAMGHDVTLGAGLWFGAGRAIPNGYKIVLRPEDVIKKIPGGFSPNEYLTYEKSALLPVAEVDWIKALREAGKTKR